MKQIIRLILRAFLVVISVLLMSNLWMVLQTSDEIYENIVEVPTKKIALVLGTSKYAVGGGLNPFFKNRMEAAANLYKSGKVQHILVSGDNRTVYYNEPKLMMEDLIQLGVPEENITLDYAGLRTLDSIVRCKEIFGQVEVTIVTQRFHSYRAVFIGQQSGLQVSGFVAEDVPISYSPLISIRELFARPLAMLDIFILGTKPQILGEKEELKI